MDVLLHALAELPGVQARIVGGQPGETDHGRLDGLARDKGVSDRVTFTGWLPPASVIAELARAHALILPNTPTHTSERYTSPLKLFDTSRRAVPSSPPIWPPCARSCVMRTTRCWSSRAHPRPWRRRYAA